MPAGPFAVFVYGTLMPGHLRWPLLELQAVGHRPAAVPGRLYDTGRGWPAAVFEASSSTLVPGVRVRLREAELDDLLAELDIMEGVPDGRYARIVVTTADGEEAWAWSTLEATDLFTPIDAWTTTDER